MTPGNEIVLRDVHDVAAPSLWPLAPGWWGVLLVLCVAIAIWVWLHVRRKQRIARANAYFDNAMSGVHSPAQQLQIMSELLRRAARRMDAGADRLTGDAWLAFLEKDMPFESFTGDTGRWIEHGLYAANVPAEKVDALMPVARARFVSWMSAK